MFDYWLRNCKEQPTWRGVAKTLNLINLKELATDVDKVYTTGIYLIQGLIIWRWDG